MNKKIRLRQKKMKKEGTKLFKRLIKPTIKWSNATKEASTNMDKFSKMLDKFICATKEDRSMRSEPLAYGRATSSLNDGLDIIDDLHEKKLYNYRIQNNIPFSTR